MRGLVRFRAGTYAAPLIRTSVRSVEKDEEEGLPCEPIQTMSDQTRDRACVERMRAGDARALEELYDRHNGLLYSVTLRIVRSAADAEEVLQEAWLQIWRGAGTYSDTRGTVGAWLTTVARSRAIDRIRSEGSRQRAEQTAGLDPPPPTEDASANA